MLVPSLKPPLIPLVKGDGIKLESRKVPNLNEESTVKSKHPTKGVKILFSLNSYKKLCGFFLNYMFPHIKHTGNNGFLIFLHGNRTDSQNL